MGIHDGGQQHVEPEKGARTRRKQFAKQQRYIEAMVYKPRHELGVRQHRAKDGQPQI